MRGWSFACVVSCSLLSFVAVPAVGADARDDVRNAAELVYIHGMTAEIAEAQVGIEGIPYLLELLRDPDFERRDNVVAFLAYLGFDSEALPLTRLLEDPPVEIDSSPEELRARLLVPEALGRIAARGGDVARLELERLGDRDDIVHDSGLTKMIGYGRTIADGLMAAVDPEPDGDAGPGDPSPAAIDSSTVSDRHPLSYANHVDTNNPISDSRVDDILAAATQFFGVEDGASDTACCIEFARDGNGLTFGSGGDGLDLINNSSELNQVIGNPVARIKVVDLIQWCGGSGSNIIGCGNTPGNGIVLVRFGNTLTEGSLWVHEFGHNVGLGHNSKPGWVMYGFLQGNNTRLDSSECFRYHNPFGGGTNQPDEIGVCDDDDDDLIVTTADNCPDVDNAPQTNNDVDSFGDLCDNCPLRTNESQNDCDFDGDGDACDLFSPPVDTCADISFSSRSRLTWQPTVTLTEKRILRGSLVGGDPWPFNESLVDELPPTAIVWTNAEAPVPDFGLFYYVVEASNNCVH